MTAWDDYCAAAQRLDAIRRGAATAAGEQARAVRAAREELGAVRARLVPQQSRLREAGVPDDELMPTPADTADGRAGRRRRPGQVLAALRQARTTADAADAALLGAGRRRRRGPGPRPAALRNLLVYGPFALAVLIVQIVLLFVASGSAGASYALGVWRPAAGGGVRPRLARRRDRVPGGAGRAGGPHAPLRRRGCLVPALLVGFAAGVMWIIN